jgi:hypothetical protein
MRMKIHYCLHYRLNEHRSRMVSSSTTHQRWLATGWMVWRSNPGDEARFSAPVQTGAGAHQVSYTMDTGSLSQGVKWPGRGVDHPPPSSPSGPSWPLLGQNLTFTLPSSGGGYKNYSSPTLCYHPPSSLSSHLFRYNLKFRIAAIFVTRDAGEVQGVSSHHLWIWIFDDLLIQTKKLKQVQSTTVLLKM